MSDQKSLSRLTRSLLLGATVGTVAISVAGCAEIEQAAAADQAGATAQTAVASDQTGVTREDQLCDLALQTQAVADVDRLLSEYPSSRCIAPLLNSLPSATLVALSPVAVQRLDQDVIDRLSARVRTQLPGATLVASDRSGGDRSDDRPRY